MCVIIAVPEGVVRPSDDVFYAAEETNPHGGGLATVISGRNPRVKWIKGISAKEMLTLVPDKGPFVAHFRIETVGGRVKELCHPFPIEQNPRRALEGQAKAVLFHNGTWPEWREDMRRHVGGVLPPGKWSDSRAMAYLAGRFGHGYLDFVDEKICVLHASGLIEYYSPRLWTQDHGVLYSNMHWVKKTTSYQYEWYDWRAERKKAHEIGTPPTASKTETKSLPPAPAVVTSPPKTEDVVEIVTAEDITESDDGPEVPPLSYNLLEEIENDLRKVVTNYDKLPIDEKREMIVHYGGFDITTYELYSLKKQAKDAEKSRGPGNIRSF